MAQFARLGLLVVGLVGLGAAALCLGPGCVLYLE